MEQGNTKYSGIFFPIVLGMLTAFGPFVTDFYLPVLPEMGKYFHSSPSLISMSLTTGMIGLAAGQLMIGPLTDCYGRHKILVVSMLLFVFSSVGCIFSSNIWMFNFMRLFQGIGGAGGIVISKSMASDIYSGRELAKFMALLGAINGIAPVVAPVIGGVMSSFTSWKGIFALLLVLGAILAASCVRLPETLVSERRIRRSPFGLYANLFKVFLNGKYSAIIAFTMFGAVTFFSYIASSSFILQEIYNLSSVSFSLCFGLNAIMIAVGAGVAGKFHKQTHCLLIASIVQLAGALCVGACLWFRLSIWLLMFAYIIMLIGFGLWQPGAVSIALDLERNRSGAASAIFGSSIFIAGGIASAIVGIGNITHMASIMAILGAFVSLIIILPLLRNLNIKI